LLISSTGLIEEETLDEKYAETTSAVTGLAPGYFIAGRKQA